MADDTQVIDKGWDALPEYTDKTEADDAVTVSLSTAPGEWLVNTTSSVVVPMSMAEVVEALRAGKLTERSLVWRQGMQEWACVDAVPLLKLAARISATPPPPPPPRSRPHATPPTPPSARPSPLQHPGLSRRSTLPFGLPAPNPAAAPVRPHATKAILPARDTSEDTGVLAVYARPAATISFDLSPEQPLRAPAKVAPAQVAPQTLAPTTSDSSPRAAHFQAADLSVVAAADYRQVKRSGKRMVLGWSLASAVGASVLTFLLARSEPGVPVAATRAPEAAAAMPTTAPEPPKVAAKAEPAPEAAPSAAEPAPAEAPVMSKAVAAALSPPKAKAPRRRRPVIAAPKDDSEPAAIETPSPSPTKDAASEPNPYDLNDAAAAKPSSGSGLEQASGEASASAGSKSPGF
jgi:hypothetical protein